MDLSTPANLLVAGIYYLIVGLLTFFSLFGVYILIRYGKSTILSLIVAVLFSLIYLQILAQSYQTLRNILI
jgi:hypothetical protein